MMRGSSQPTVRVEGTACVLLCDVCNADAESDGFAAYHLTIIAFGDRQNGCLMNDKTSRIHAFQTYSGQTSITRTLRHLAVVLLTWYCIVSHMIFSTRSQSVL